MSDTNKRKDERFWREMAGEVQDVLRLRPLTLDEAAAAYAEATNEPLSDEEVDDLVELALGQMPREESYEERVGRASEQDTLAREVGEVIGFNRNGDGDTFSPEIEEKIRRGREEALRREQEKKEPEEQDGLDADEEY
jgi:hypothetical protein